MSKSISGYGVPMAPTLFPRELGAWTPGEHNGTFLGHIPAFVTVTKALQTYCQNPALTDATVSKWAFVRERLENITSQVWRRRACGGCLLVETSGPSDEVDKPLAALTFSEADLESGMIF